MKSITLLSCALLCSTAFAGPRCFVPNYTGGTVSVYDQAYLTDFGGVEQDVRPGTYQLDAIAVGSNPTKVAVTLDGRWAFSANSGSNTVSWFSAQMVHDPAVGGLNYPVYHRNIPVGSQPRDLCVGRNPSNGTLRLFVANSQSSYLTAIDPAESVLGVKTYATANISVTGASGAPAYPRALHGPRASSPDTSGWYPFVSDGYVATWNTNGATVNKISSSGTSTPFATLPITPSRRSPRSLSVSQDGKQIWVVSAAYEGGQEVDAGYVDVVQASNGALLYSSGRIPLVGGAGVTLNGAGG